ncbi:MAG TPA: FKBP-type peptidyl-prolyl cis-trans isomerase [Vicinamibacterales bacterium]|jgi:FKBP-type peptidyl-prolyl cis-trans isomerase
MPARACAFALAFFLAALTAAGCVGSATPTRTPAYSQTDLRIGGGDEATAGKTISVNYTGWLHDPSKPEEKGAVFDSSVGGTPLTFVLGTGGVIAGWERGVPGMRVGGLRRLVIPPSLAYGAARNGPLPPYAALVFDIELVSVVGVKSDR